MMPYFWDGHMGGGTTLLAFIIWLVVCIDLVLAGIWLWQHIIKR